MKASRLQGYQDFVFDRQPASSDREYLEGWEYAKKEREECRALLNPNKITGKCISDVKKNQIITLHLNGFKIGKIADITHSARATIKKVIDKYNGEISQFKQVDKN